MTSAKNTASSITSTASIASFASAAAIVSTASIALALLAGCTPLTPNLDSQFGNALVTLKRTQTIDPAAPARTDNPAQDGKSAAEATGRYVKSFNAPAPHQSVLGGGMGGAR